MLPVSRSPQFYKPYAAVCCEYIVTTFNSPAVILPPGREPMKLEDLVCKILARTRIMPDVACIGLLYLRRLKGQFPTIKSSTGDAALVLCVAILIAQKYNDETTWHAANQWCLATGRIIPLKTMVAAEKHFLEYLSWDLRVETQDLNGFKEEIGWPRSIDVPEMTWLPSVHLPSEDTEGESPDPPGMQEVRGQDIHPNSSQEPRTSPVFLENVLVLKVLRRSYSCDYLAPRPLAMDVPRFLDDSQLPETC